MNLIMSHVTVTLPQPQKTHATDKITHHIPHTDEKTAMQHAREELESVHILNLEAEKKNLKKELDDTLETVDILKRVIADYAQRK